MKNSITVFLKDNWELVLFAEDMAHPYAPDWQSITITRAESSEGFCAHIVTTGSLEDIAKKIHISYGWRTSI